MNSRGTPKPLKTDHYRKSVITLEVWRKCLLYTLTTENDASRFTVEIIMVNSSKTRDTSVNNYNLIIICMKIDCFFSQ